MTEVIVPAKTLKERVELLEFAVARLSNENIYLIHRTKDLMRDVEALMSTTGSEQVTAAYIQESGRIFRR